MDRGASNAPGAAPEVEGGPAPGIFGHSAPAARRDIGTPPKPRGRLVQPEEAIDLQPGSTSRSPRLGGTPQSMPGASPRLAGMPGKAQATPRSEGTPLGAKGKTPSPRGAHRDRHGSTDDTTQGGDVAARRPSDEATPTRAKSLFDRAIGPTVRVIPTEQKAEFEAQVLARLQLHRRRSTTVVHDVPHGRRSGGAPHVGGIDLTRSFEDVEGGQFTLPSGRRRRKTSTAAGHDSLHHEGGPSNGSMNGSRRRSTDRYGFGVPGGDGSTERRRGSWASAKGAFNAVPHRRSSSIRESGTGSGDHSQKPYGQGDQGRTGGEHDVAEDRGPLLKDASTASVGQRRSKRSSQVRRGKVALTSVSSTSERSDDSDDDRGPPRAAAIATEPLAIPRESRHRLRGSHSHNHRRRSQRRRSHSRSRSPSPKDRGPDVTSPNLSDHHHGHAHGSGGPSSPDSDVRGWAKSQRGMSGVTPDGSRLSRPSSDDEWSTDDDQGSVDAGDLLDAHGKSGGGVGPTAGSTLLPFERKQMERRRFEGAARLTGTDAVVRVQRRYGRRLAPTLDRGKLIHGADVMSGFTPAPTVARRGPLPVTFTEEQRGALVAEQCDRRPMQRHDPKLRRALKRHATAAAASANNTDDTLGFSPSGSVLKTSSHASPNPGSKSAVTPPPGLLTTPGPGASAKAGTCVTLPPIARTPSPKRQGAVRIDDGEAPFTVSPSLSAKKVGGGGHHASSNKATSAAAKLTPRSLSGHRGDVVVPPSTLKAPPASPPSVALSPTFEAELRPRPALSSTAPAVSEGGAMSLLKSHGGGQRHQGSVGGQQTAVARREVSLTKQQVRVLQAQLLQTYVDQGLVSESDALESVRLRVPPGLLMKSLGLPPLPGHLHRIPDDPSASTTNGQSKTTVDGGAGTFLTASGKGRGGGSAKRSVNTSTYGSATAGRGAAEPRTLRFVVTANPTPDHGAPGGHGSRHGGHGRGSFDDQSDGSPGSVALSPGRSGSLFGSFPSLMSTAAGGARSKHAGRKSLARSKSGHTLAEFLSGNVVRVGTGIDRRRSTVVLPDIAVLEASIGGEDPTAHTRPEFIDTDTKPPNIEDELLIDDEESDENSENDASIAGPASPDHAGFGAGAGSGQSPIGSPRTKAKSLKARFSRIPSLLFDSLLAPGQGFQRKTPALRRKKDLLIAHAAFQHLVGIAVKEKVRASDGTTRKRAAPVFLSIEADTEQHRGQRTNKGMTNRRRSQLQLEDEECADTHGDANAPADPHSFHPTTAPGGVGRGIDASAAAVVLQSMQQRRASFLFGIGDVSKMSSVMVAKILHSLPDGSPHSPSPTEPSAATPIGSMRLGPNRRMTAADSVRSLEGSSHTLRSHGDVGSPSSGGQGTYGVLPEEMAKPQVGPLYHHCVIIGVSTVPLLAGFTPFEAAARNADSIARVFERLGMPVTRLFETDATVASVHNALRAATSDAAEHRGRVLVYFSGHVRARDEDATPLPGAPGLGGAPARTQSRGPRSLKDAASDKDKGKDQLPMELQEGMYELLFSDAGHPQVRPETILSISRLAATRSRPAAVFVDAVGRDGSLSTIRCGGPVVTAFSARVPGRWHHSLMTYYVAKALEGGVRAPTVPVIAGFVERRLQRRALPAMDIHSADLTAHSTADPICVRSSLPFPDHVEIKRAATQRRLRHCMATVSALTSVIYRRNPRAYMSRLAARMRSVAFVTQNTLASVDMTVPFSVHSLRPHGVLRIDLSPQAKLPTTGTASFLKEEFIRLVLSAGGSDEEMQVAREADFLWRGRDRVLEVSMADRLPESYIVTKRKACTARCVLCNVGLALEAPPFVPAAPPQAVAPPQLQLAPPALRRLSSITAADPQSPTTLLSHVTSTAMDHDASDVATPLSMSMSMSMTNTSGLHASHGNAAGVGGRGHKRSNSPGGRVLIPGIDRGAPDSAVTAQPFNAFAYNPDATRHCDAFLGPLLRQCLDSSGVVQADDVTIGEWGRPSAFSGALVRERVSFSFDGSEHAFNRLVKHGRLGTFDIASCARTALLDFSDVRVGTATESYELDAAVSLQRFFRARWARRYGAPRLALALELCEKYSRVMDAAAAAVQRFRDRRRRDYFQSALTAMDAAEMRERREIADAHSAAIDGLHEYLVGTWPVLEDRTRRWFHTEWLISVTLLAAEREMGVSYVEAASFVNATTLLCKFNAAEARARQKIASAEFRLRCLLRDELKEDVVEAMEKAKRREQITQQFLRQTGSRGTDGTATIGSRHTDDAAAAAATAAAAAAASTVPNTADEKQERPVKSQERRRPTPPGGSRRRPVSRTVSPAEKGRRAVSPPSDAHVRATSLQSPLRMSVPSATSAATTSTKPPPHVARQHAPPLHGSNSPASHGAIAHGTATGQPSVMAQAPPPEQGSLAHEQSAVRPRGALRPESAEGSVARTTSPGPHGPLSPTSVSSVGLAESGLGASLLGRSQRGSKKEDGRGGSSGPAAVVRQEGVAVSVASIEPTMARSNARLQRQRRQSMDAVNALPSPSRNK